MIDQQHAGRAATVFGIGARFPTMNFRHDVFLDDPAEGLHQPET
jgi:hypothetical protein